VARPRFTAQQIAETVAGKLPSNQDAIGCAASPKDKPKRSKEAKVVILPPSSYDPAAGIAIIMLPIPPRALHPNASCSWKAKIKPKQLARDGAASATIDLLKGERPLWRNASVHIRMVAATKAHSDKDNIVAWVKAVLDGVVKGGGLVVDDYKLDAPTVEIASDRFCPHLELHFRRKE
jgi:hypothetical protein